MLFMNKIILMVMFVLLMLPVVSASEVHDLTVTDKHIKEYGMDNCYILHTREFGDVRVSHDDYNKVWINDTVTVEFGAFSVYFITKINGVDNK